MCNGILNPDFASVYSVFVANTPARELSRVLVGLRLPFVPQLATDIGAPDVDSEILFVDRRGTLAYALFLRYDFMEKSP